MSDMITDNTAALDWREQCVVLSPYIMDVLFNSEEPDALQLYNFYQYTARWQRTNQVYATTSYAAKGLKWSEDKVRKMKKILLDFGLIEEIQTRKQGNDFGKRYIRIHHIWTKEKADEIMISRSPENTRASSSSRDSRSPDFTQCAKNFTNALSVTNLKASSITNTVPPRNSTMPKRTKHPKQPCQELADQLAMIVKENKNIQITSSQITSWSKELNKLLTQHKLNPLRVKKTLNWYSLHFGELYIPVIQSGASLREKYLQLETAMDRENKTEENHSTNNLQHLRGNVGRYSAQVAAKTIRFNT